MSLSSLRIWLLWRCFSQFCVAFLQKIRNKPTMPCFSRHFLMSHFTITNVRIANADMSFAQKKTFLKFAKFSKSDIFKRVLWKTFHRPFQKCGRFFLVRIVKYSKLFIKVCPKVKCLAVKILFLNFLLYFQELFFL